MTQGPFRLLHVGCGRKNSTNLPPPFDQPSWQEIRLDIDPSVEPDIVASITDMRAVENGAMHALWSAHNLEHLYAHEVPAALSEFARVVVPNGFVVITVPDLQMIAESIAAGNLTEQAYLSPAGPVAPIDMLYGFRPSLADGRLTMAHRTGFTAGSLERALYRAGFETVAARPDRFWALWAVASRSAEDAERVRLLAEDLAHRAHPANM